MFDTIRSGLAASTRQLDIITDNMANAKSAGFKRSTASFSDVYAATVGNQTQGIGVKLEGSHRAFSQGSIETTQNTLDLAVLGQCMFVLGPRDGSAAPIFTREGGVTVDSEGYLVSSEGLSYLSDELEPLQLPASWMGAALEAVNVNSDGAIMAVYGQNEAIKVGQVGLASFVDVARLQPLGSNRFAVSRESGVATYGRPGGEIFGTVQAGALEVSNVDLTNELAMMIRAQQIYNANSRALQTEVDLGKRLIDG